MNWKQLHGKELSYNNLLDIEATMDVLAEFDAPAACVIKHNNPCGIASAPDLVKAVEDAIDRIPFRPSGIVGLIAPVTPRRLKGFGSWVLKCWWRQPSSRGR